jgi:hypothetical protein
MAGVGGKAERWMRGRAFSALSLARRHFQAEALYAQGFKGSGARRMKRIVLLLGRLLALPACGGSYQARDMDLKTTLVNPSPLKIGSRRSGALSLYEHQRQRTGLHAAALHALSLTQLPRTIRNGFAFRRNSGYGETLNCCNPHLVEFWNAP